MFIAIDQGENTVNLIDTPEEELRLLSSSGMIFCPDCKRQVRYYSGEQRTAHFKHVHSPDCTYESEPETEEHIKGKILIRKWLQQLFPDIQVEFEYKIIETNQRADVMAIFPNGKKVAFEMQCSKIQGSVWKERHELYKKAGIKDFWILGQSVHKYAKTNGELDKNKHQLVSLASTIYEKEGVVVFLDTNTSMIRGLYKHNFSGWHSDTILTFEEELFSIVQAKLFRPFIGTDFIKKDYDNWIIEYERQVQRRKMEEEQYRLEEERKEREYAEMLRIREEEINKLLSRLKSETLNSVKAKMRPQEIELFERLLKKHGFNDNNFPGIFKVYTPYNNLIQTPHELWQLWVYDKFIYGKKDTYPKVWLPNIQKEMEIQHKKGIFRIKRGHRDSHFSFAIYRYVEALSILDMVIQLGASSTKYQQICYDALPPLNSREVHTDVAYFLSTNRSGQLSTVTQQILDSFKLYRDMIMKYEPHTKEYVSFIQIVEYTNNLIHVNINLANDWERSFTTDMLKILKKGYNLSEKQKERLEKIKQRVESQLGISLSYN
jgi:competence protein CoiA